ncbi:Pre-mRNA-splicing factor SYF2 [Sporothrix epigloea]|uniref:Pre-mRNA-splicing factor SYF2 n=1 Tax=Sporothrix epigloea TaxID=1892477 RepID=A0ABP0DW44_9PEZI
MPPRKRTTRASKKAELATEEPTANAVSTQAIADDGSEDVSQATHNSSAEKTLKQKTTQQDAPQKSTTELKNGSIPRDAEQDSGLAVGEAEVETARAPAEEAEKTAKEAAADQEFSKESALSEIPETKQDKTPPITPAPTAADRMARFKALQARAKTSSDQNLKAAAAETQRLSTDASQLNSLRRKVAVASHKILKAEVEDAGGDFERKRAWDWTAEESEQWDKRMKKKAAHRDNAAFQDYTQEAGKVYKKQIRNAAALAAPDLEQYARDKLAAVERAAAAGTLEIVETADGELIAVDKDGTFFSTAESTSFADNRPSREAIDRLVSDQKKADEASLRKRRARNGEDADVTYINEKNKHFNQKLARFYNKYTTEIRESFERGTMI